jgi:hypothetical protein
VSEKNVFSGEPSSKQMDPVFAERLWPLYQKTGGNAAEVLRQAKDVKVVISKPTLDKLIKNFGFKEKLAQAQKNHFSASVDHTGELTSLLAEVTGHKNRLQKAIEESPNDLQAHRLYGDYIGKILEIRRQLILAKQVDKNQLVIDALKETIQFMMDNGLSEPAETVGEHLETIIERIKARWDSKQK